MVGYVGDDVYVVVAVVTEMPGLTGYKLQTVLREAGASYQRGGEVKAAKLAVERGAAHRREGAAEQHEVPRRHGSQVPLHRFDHRPHPGASRSSVLGARADRPALAPSRATDCPAGQRTSQIALVMRRSSVRFRQAAPR